MDELVTGEVISHDGLDLYFVGSGQDGIVERVSLQEHMCGWEVGRDQRAGQQGLLQQENGQWPKAGQWGCTGGCGCRHMGTVRQRTCHMLNAGGKKRKEL